MDNGASSPAETNKAPQELSEEFVQVVLTYNKMTGELQVGASEKNLDLMLVVAAQWYRQLDVSYRIVSGIAAQQQVAQQKQDAALAAEIARRGMRA